MSKSNGRLNPVQSSNAAPIHSPAPVAPAQTDSMRIRFLRRINELFLKSDPEAIRLQTDPEALAKRFAEVVRDGVTSGKMTPEKLGAEPIADLRYVLATLDKSDPFRAQLASIIQAQSPTVLEVRSSAVGAVLYSNGHSNTVPMVDVSIIDPITGKRETETFGVKKWRLFMAIFRNPSALAEITRACNSIDANTPDLRTAHERDAWLGKKPRKSTAPAQTTAPAPVVDSASKFDSVY